jgi:hypothetical protein
MRRMSSAGMLAGGVLLILVVATLVGLASLGGGPGSQSAMRPGLVVGEAQAAEQAGGGPGGQRVLLAFGVGSVLTRDGTLWVYRPDKGAWLTIDEAFSEEGRETHILPLPVPATEIAQMESFGFFLAKNGDVWFYEINTDRWGKLPPPAQAQ